MSYKPTLYDFFLINKKRNMMFDVFQRNEMYSTQFIIGLIQSKMVTCYHHHDHESADGNMTGWQWKNMYTYIH